MTRQGEQPVLGPRDRGSDRLASADGTIRHAQPSDYGRVIGRVNAWWGGRDMAPMLPKLFFLHFEGTSFVAEREDGQLAGFLVGFVSQTVPEEAYIHFVGVAPEERGSGLGRELYERFFDIVREHGCTIVRCVTSLRTRTRSRSTPRWASRSTVSPRTTTGRARTGCSSSSA